MPQSTADGSCGQLCRDITDCTFGKCLDVGIPSLGVCEQDCDPLTNTGCEQFCYLINVVSFPTNVNDGGSTYCSSTGGAALGDACVGAADCGPQMTCAQSVCRSLCDVASPTCPSNMACASFNPKIMKSGKEIGVCVIPTL
ncbi:MAG: hypothetical protein QM831_36060 [Kofleriaceae bacterium]